MDLKVISVNRLKKILQLLGFLLFLMVVGAWAYMYHLRPVHIDYSPSLWEQWEARKFVLPNEMSANLFASEKSFELGNVVAINFDSKGRLWALTMPSYPQYLPGQTPNDKLLILEDTNGDGKADQQTIFADSLYLPTGFEFGNGGVYLAEQSNLLFLQDTDGDDKADVRKILLQGFGTEDCHHVPSAFEWGPDGALYFHQGVFLHSQIETPYGPVRVVDGCTYRYHPRTEFLEPVVNYPFYNPWGQFFDEWGRHFIADATDGSNYYANPMSGKIDYPNKHGSIGSFTNNFRPTCGIELVSSRHFPEEYQGDLLVNSVLFMQGTWQHKIFEESSGFGAREKGIFLMGKYSDFRPVDLQFAPDGTLYIADWNNPLIGHQQYSFRDERRDHSHGRIWRISHDAKPLLVVQDFSQMDIPSLLDKLNSEELRDRYRCRRELWKREKQEVLEALPEFLRKHAENERIWLEALWLHQSFDEYNGNLLNRVLHAQNPRVRAAGFRVLRYMFDREEESLNGLKKGIEDDSPFVRLEALVSLSYFESEAAAKLALKVLDKPTDLYIDYALAETYKHLKPYLPDSFWKDSSFAANNQELVRYLYRSPEWTVERLWQLPKTASLLEEILLRKELPQAMLVKSLEKLALIKDQTELETLLAMSHRLDKSEYSNEHPLIAYLLSMASADLKKERYALLDFTRNPVHLVQRQIGIAALIKADGGTKKILQEEEGYLIEPKDWVEISRCLPDENLGQDLLRVAAQLLSDQADSIRIYGTQMLGFIPGHETQKLQLLLPNLQHNLLLPTSVLVLNLMDLDKLPSDLKLSLVNVLFAQLKVLTKAKSKGELTTDLTILISKLQNSLPNQIRAEFVQLKQQLEVQEIVIRTLKSQMKYDLASIQVKAGRKVKIILINEDMMPHNLVITQPGALEKVGTAADQMAAETSNTTQEYVPDMAEVLFATPLVEAGQQYELIFVAPEQAGSYPFVCTFPGHWTLMNGLMEVVEDNV